MFVVSCKQQHVYICCPLTAADYCTTIPCSFILVLNAWQALTLPVSHRQHCPHPQSSIVEARPAGTELVKLTIAEMIKGQCEEVVLEAEVTNSGALALYQNLGFIRDKRLHRY